MSGQFENGRDSFQNAQDEDDDRPDPTAPLEQQVQHAPLAQGNGGFGAAATTFGQALQSVHDAGQNNAIDTATAANLVKQNQKLQDAAEHEKQVQADYATALQNKAIASQQQANQQTRDTLLGIIADPSQSAAVLNVDQAAVNNQNALASSSSTNAYQSGDLAQTAQQTANTSVGELGQSAIDEQQAGAQARQDALSELGQLDDSTTAQDLALSQTDVQNQQANISNTFNALQSEASGLDAQQRQQISSYGEQLNYYMNQYQLAVAQGEAGRNAALGWIKLSLGILATAGALVATVATGGAAAPTLVAAGAADAALAN